MQEHKENQAISGVSNAEFARALIKSQRAAIDAVETAMPAIEAAAEGLAEAFRAGGRAIYAGAGSSGLIALQDGAELAGTFGLKPSQVGYLVAGGLGDIVHIDAAAEDDVHAARRDFALASIESRDVVIAVSASGSTPYTLACAQAAKSTGARIIALANRPGAPLLALADFPILLDSGPEALHGSTRLAAGTAQKAALGVLSTLANASLGHVWRGHMVNVRPENDKLRKRAAHIVASLTGVSEETARDSLQLADDDVKVAILIASGAQSHTAARQMIDKARGQLGRAISYLRVSA
jgi:N-acetylmuramic acid 6-phosphate etherase